jgi:hypothetical protein
MAFAPLSPVIASDAVSDLGNDISVVHYALPSGTAASAVRVDAPAQDDPDTASPPVSILAALPENGVPTRTVYGPQDPDASPDQPPETRYRSFGSQVGRVKWELLAVLAYYTAINGSKLFENPTSFHFHDEGWFGTSTDDLGVDKLAHAYSTYVLSELFYARLKHKTDNAPNIQFTAAAIGMGIMLYTEFYDGIEPSSGWSWQDVTFDVIGASFSILRNSVPGLDKKLDYRLMIMPNAELFTAAGKRHFEQQRYFLALKLSGFNRFKEGPLRLLELHLGYYAKDFSNEDRAEGIEAKRRIFVGFGINLRELFFRNSHTRVGRAVGEVLDYFQPPYTAAHFHITN